MIKRVLIGIGLAVTLLVGGLSAWSYMQEPEIGPLTPIVDRILVEKVAHRMTLLRGGEVVRRYDVALGRGGLGPKEREGDGRVPEGVYRITSRNSNSAYHPALRIGYPTADQARQAAAQGIDPGGDIMIHGQTRGLGWAGRMRGDWTAGCIAVTNAEMEEIWRLVPDGVPIEIRP